MSIFIFTYCMGFVTGVSVVWALTWWLLYSTRVLVERRLRMLDEEQ